MPTNHRALAAREQGARRTRWTLVLMGALVACDARDQESEQRALGAADGGAVTDNVLDAGLLAPATDNNTRPDAPAAIVDAAARSDAASPLSTSPDAAAFGGRDAASAPTSSTTAATNPLDFVAVLLGAADAGARSGDASDPGGWRLTPDSAPECPPEPPPIPIVGGLCAGVYFFCTWKSPAGASYTCTCDWVHWLCL